MNNFKCFLFDMGNTVLDFHTSSLSDAEMEKRGLQKVQEYISKEYKIKNAEEIETEVFVPWFNYLNSTRKKVLLETRIDEAVFNFFIKKNIILTVDEIIFILKLHYSEFAHNVIINDGFIEVAKFLKQNNKKLGLISNASYPDIIFLDILKSLRIYDFFDSAVFSYSNVYMKPHSSMFIKSLMNLQIKPSEAVMIGDNYSADILGAKAAGMKTCLYDNKRRYKKQDADFYINDFSELIFA